MIGRRVKVALVAAAFVLLGSFSFPTPPSSGHLAYKPRTKAKTLQVREYRQQRNLAHCRYVAKHGRGRTLAWHRNCVRWIKPELAETRLLITPAIPSVWYELAVCESGRRPPAWHINTGNGFYGGLQFSYSTWKDAGGQRFTTYAHEATPGQQVAIAASWLTKTSWLQWPECSRRLGYR